MWGTLTAVGGGRGNALRGRQIGEGLDDQVGLSFQCCTNLFACYLLAVSSWRHMPCGWLMFGCKRVAADAEMCYTFTEGFSNVTLWDLTIRVSGCGVVGV